MTEGVVVGAFRGVYGSCTGVGECMGAGSCDEDLRRRGVRLRRSDNRASLIVFISVTCVSDASSVVEEDDRRGGRE